jgi:glutamate-1-semialdehyde aminotransferase
MSNDHRDAPHLARLVDSIRHDLARSLKEAPEGLDPDQSFADMGADSLILLETLQEVNTRHGVALTVQEMYESIDTIAKLARHIAAHGERMPASPTPAAADPVAAGSLPDGLGEATAPVRGEALEPGDRRSIEAIVRHQLDLMERQLALLGRRGAASAAPASRAPVESAAIPATAIRPAAAQAPSAGSTVAAAVTGPEVDRFSAFGVALGADERATDADKVAHIAELAARLNRKMPRSRSEAQAHRRVLADNRAPAGFRPLLKDLIYPVLAEEARGARVVDIDGNEYVDFTMGFGAHLFGHAPGFVVEAVKRQIELGMPIGPQSPRAGRVAELIAELTGHERVTFCNSGTEATMTAVRLARATTGRDKVVVFRNSYHGTFDGFLARGTASSPAGKPASLGTPTSMVQDTIVLDYCSDDALAFIERHHGEIAAVVAEPVQSRAPSLRPGPFLRKLRHLTQDRGIALVFDEVITGFRCAPGGAQEYFDVRADLCTYGKVLGGGMPIGVIAGSADYMDRVDGGWWQYGDASYPAQPTIFFAGTFSKHPLAMAASLAVLEHIKSAGRGLHDALNRRTDELCRQLNAAFAQEGADLSAESFSSLFRFSSRGNLDLFHHHLRDAGFFIWEGRNCFVSTAHTEPDLDRFVTAVQHIVRDLVAKKLLPARRPASEAITAAAARPAGPSPIADAQRRFHRLVRQSPDGNVACNLCYGLLFQRPVDADRLAGAVASVMERAEALWYRVDLERGTQEPAGERRLEIPRVAVDRPSAEPGLEELLAAEQEEPLDPSSGQNVRVRLRTFSDGETLLTVCAHHLVCDGWSLTVLIERIADAYDRPDAAPAADVPYSRWLDHEAAYRQGDRHARDRAFWQGAIEAIAAYRATRAPGAVRHASRIGARPGGRARLSIGQPTADLLRARARTDRVTVFTSLLASFQVLLHRVYRGQPPIIGVPFANRTSGELKQVVGSCVNLLPLLPLLPLHGATATIEAGLAHTKQALNEAFQHAGFPYDEMAALHERVTGASSPVEVTFNVEPIGQVPAFGGPPPALVAAPNRQIEFDLMFNVFVLENEIRIEADHGIEVIAEDVAYGWLNLFGKIVENYARGPA